MVRVALPLGMIGRVALVVGALAAGWYCVSTVLDWRADSEALSGVKQELADEKAKLVARLAQEAEKERRAEALEREVAKARRAAAQARAERATEYAKKPYTDCVLPANGLRLIEQRRADINAAGPAR